MSLRRTLKQTDCPSAYLHSTDTVLFYVPSTVLTQEEMDNLEHVPIFYVVICISRQPRPTAKIGLGQIRPGPTKQIVLQSNMIQTIIFHPFFICFLTISHLKHTHKMNNKTPAGVMVQYNCYAKMVMRLFMSSSPSAFQVLCWVYFFYFFLDCRWR